MENKLYHCKSVTLGKSWVIRAGSVNDASIKMIDFCKEDLEKIDKNDGDVEVDMQFKLIDKDIVEI